ncbi:hypothetical protein [Myxococcus sp. RHSTA-1-4]|uniref:hypothetical protein n=1 Tax=Myxococcus sp. RHSTA-1-4 TaxID=2874601 RepID=UPI001CBF1119|nr:hypothetical protein [Myxococcus sp. RHSTA-1-4]
MARRKKAEEMAACVRNLLAMDAVGIMRRLDARRDEMFALFSRLRSREPLLGTIASRYGTGAFEHLIHLFEQEQAVIAALAPLLSAAGEGHGHAPDREKENPVAPCWRHGALSSQWRRRESNPRRAVRKPQRNRALTS